MRSMYDLFAKFLVATMMFAALFCAPLQADESKTIAGNAAETEALSTLVAAVQAADLVETLNGEGPFTVFAPTNDAFAALPAGTVEMLLKPENKQKLQKILSYHVLPGKATAEVVMDLVSKGGGHAKVTTVQGEELTLKVDGDKVTVTDANGNTATVVQADVMNSNGVVHVIDAVLMPAMN